MVFKPVSSIKTRRRASQADCCSRHRFRAVLTSGRSCSAARVVFFIAQPQLLQAMPQGGQADRDLQLFPAAALQLVQRQVRLRPDPTPQGPVVLFQTGTTIAADLLGPTGAGPAVLVPKAFHAFAADPETPADFAGAFSTRAGGDDALTQILAQRPHNSPSMKEE